MAIQILVVRLKDGSIGELCYEVANGTSRLLPQHLSWSGRPPFSLLDVVERLETRNWPDGESD